MISVVNVKNKDSLWYINNTPKSPFAHQAMDMFDLGETFGSLHVALTRVKCPTMVIGVQTDILFPVWQQRELANILQESGVIFVHSRAANYG